MSVVIGIFLFFYAVVELAWEVLRPLDSYKRVVDGLSTRQVREYFENLSGADKLKMLFKFFYSLVSTLFVFPLIVIIAFMTNTGNTIFTILMLILWVISLVFALKSYKNKNVLQGDGMQEKKDEIPVYVDWNLDRWSRWLNRIALCYLWYLFFVVAGVFS